MTNGLVSQLIFVHLSSPVYIYPSVGCCSLSPLESDVFYLACSIGVGWLFLSLVFYAYTILLAILERSGTRLDLGTAVFAHMWILHSSFCFLKTAAMRTYTREPVEGWEKEMPRLYVCSDHIRIHI